MKDMTRRCITISLSPQCETPASRSFTRPDLVREVLHERGQFVSAALTIIRAWIKAGAPRTQCKGLAGFEEWSDFCRQPLLWLGLDDPTASIFQAMAEDPDREILARLLEAWSALFGRTSVMVREVLRRTEVRGDKEIELREVLEDIAGEKGGINPRKLGWWIRRHEGRISGNYRITRSIGNSGGERWKVEEVSSVLEVFTQGSRKSCA